MSEIEFSRKLSEMELKEYKGSIETGKQISTPMRIDFNSSPVFQVHCLNDCSMNGPDLLNDLSGTVLRIREDEVAFIGDIRIRILEVDHHVHGFLRRNSQTDRASDVYVNTVLTFRDKPAPAMPQQRYERRQTKQKKLSRKQQRFSKKTHTWTMYAILPAPEKKNDG